MQTNPARQTVGRVLESACLPFPMMELSAAELGRRLKMNANRPFRRRQQRFSREPLKTIGVPAPAIRALAGAAARQWRRDGASIGGVIETAGELWSSGYLEQRQLACFLLEKFHQQLGEAEWRILDGWVDSLSNWAETDALACAVLAKMIDAEPARALDLIRWTATENRWRRRSAAVALTPLARKGRLLGEAFAVCDGLAPVRDDLVEKAVGWLLKDASRAAPWSVAGFLADRRLRFSRTTVRYACRTMPDDVRRKVLSGE